eukprot:s2813_g2.t4
MRAHESQEIMPQLDGTYIPGDPRKRRIAPETCVVSSEFFTGIEYWPVRTLAQNAHLGVVQVVLPRARLHVHDPSSSIDYQPLCAAMASKEPLLDEERTVSFYGSSNNDGPKPAAEVVVRGWQKAKQVVALERMLLKLDVKWFPTGIRIKLDKAGKCPASTMQVIINDTVVVAKKWDNFTTECDSGLWPTDRAKIRARMGEIFENAVVSAHEFPSEGDFSVKDPDEVNLDEPITWMAPTLTFLSHLSAVAGLGSSTAQSHPGLLTDLNLGPAEFRGVSSGGWLTPEWSQAGLVLGVAMCFVFTANTTMSCLETSKSFMRFCKDAKETNRQGPLPFPSSMHSTKVTSVNWRSQSQIRTPVDLLCTTSSSWSG